MRSHDDKHWSCDRLNLWPKNKNVRWKWRRGCGRVWETGNFITIALAWTVGPHHHHKHGVIGTFYLIHAHTHCTSDQPLGLACFDDSFNLQEVDTTVMIVSQLKILFRLMTFGTVLFLPSISSRTAYTTVHAFPLKWGTCWRCSRVVILVLLTGVQWC